ncbi:hypothetical protein DSO57_1018784 [Entomophthora muscae]|uniref:Uncharacterized protein n=1 Tax=Entomophthora muscae TaxID=34485 RepID=A0ACC2SH22_9FUNG|nr:hypothetical protein DSO57_1018784 [Entomophthora muscae]
MITGHDLGAALGPFRLKYGSLPDLNFLGKLKGDIRQRLNLHHPSHDSIEYFVSKESIPEPNLNPYI